MSKLILNDELLIAKGGERDCYIHPEDENKLLKFYIKRECIIIKTN